ncbi:MAG TPA: histidine kinase [Xanthomonadales bacterium]|nr:histidine kinase [Xanthomonadales bacterium]
MARLRFIVQLLIGWLPVGALFCVLIATAHRTPVLDAAPIALQMMLTAAALGVLVDRFAARLPWPHPMRARFVFAHLAAAPAYAVSWWMLNNVVESIRHGAIAIVVGPGIVPYLVLGVWLYVMVAGVAYAQRGAARRAELEAQAARAQLAALRSQLHPHFLFNALHTVVQLVPVRPDLATQAAMQLADLLRVATGVQRDLLPLREEWAFVQRYLAIEALRLGERMRVEAAIDDAALDLLVPSFALQTLVENAVRHAVAPREAASVLRIAARLDGERLVLEVVDDGPGIDAHAPLAGSGTGLRRLRERLAALHGSAAALELGTRDGTGGVARVLLPRTNGDEDGD